MKATYVERVLLGAMLIFSSNLWAQGWIQIDDFPSTARDDGTSFSIGTNAYCGTGLAVGWTPSNDFFAFDMLSDSWSAISSLPSSEARQYASGFASTEHGYVFGGLNGTGYLNDLWKYDPISDTWSEATPLPSSGRSGSGCFVIGDTAYIVGGKTQSIQSISEVWAYSFSSDTWSLKNPLPDSLWRASAIYFQDKGYVVFGVNNSGVYSNQLFEYSPTTGNWTTLSSFPGVGRTYSGISLLNDEIVLLAGRDSIGNSYNDFWRYTPLQDSWSLSANLPSDQRRGGMCFASNTSIYYTTGINLNDIRLTETWKYDPFLNLNEEAKTAVTLYPNPAQSTFDIRGLSTCASVEYHINSGHGRLIRSNTIKFEEPILIGDLPKGYYYVTIQFESHRVIKKLIVN